LSKKWVFEALVKNENDAIGLISYALYKNSKHQLAVSLRNDGHDEGYIQDQVNTFHNHTLGSNHLQQYRDQANVFLNKMIDQIEKELKTAHEAEKAKLIKDHSKALKTEKTKIFNKIKAYQHVSKKWYEKLALWLFSGIPGAFSSLLIAALMIGAAVLSVSDESRNRILASLIADYLNVDLATQEAAKDLPKTRPQSLIKEDGKSHSVNSAL
jgi:hypothetical protein